MRRAMPMRKIARGSFAASVLLFAAGATLLAIDDPSSLVILVVIGLAVAGYGGLGMLLASRRPQNPLGWLFSAVALAFVVWIFGMSYATFRSPRVDALGTLPGSAAAGWVSVLVPIAILPIALPLFLLVFPDGTLRSRWYRVAVAAAIAGGAISVVGFAGTIERWSGTLPLVTPRWIARIPSIREFPAAGLLLSVGAAFGGCLSLVLRYRSSTGEERQPLRLLVGVVASMAVATALGPFLSWAGFVLMFFVDGFGILVGIPLATTAAVLTYGLYDVGVVMRKGIVYGLLVALMVLVLGFVALLVSPLAMGNVGGQRTGTRIVLSLLLFALILSAVWRQAKRTSRRLVYGKRATPYEVMSDFSDRVRDAYSTEDVLPRMATILRQGTGAEHVDVWLRVGDSLRQAAHAPDGSAATASQVRVMGEELPELPAGSKVFPVRHRGELLGAFSIRMPPSEPLSGDGGKLVDDLAAQAGLVLRNVRLTEELKGTIEQLRASRQRIVTAQDARAKKLERDLHDGAQQQLVALTVKLRLLEEFAERDPAKAKGIAAELRGEAGEALENLRDLARGIYPPLLADRGLVEALEAQAKKSAMPVIVEAEGVGRFPQEVEAAVYFSCLEALQNVAKYAGATRATVRLGPDGERLRFEVRDDGEGFDPSSTTFGTGLQGIADRLAALGGELRIDSDRGRGTCVTGSLPAEVRT